MSAPALAEPLVGSQVPRVLVRPDNVAGSSGPELVEWARGFDMYMDPWQALVLDVVCSERRNGTWAAQESGLLVSRQNGKGSIFEVRGLGGIFLFKEKMILYSCHEFKTAEQYLNRIEAVVKNYDDLRRKVKTVMHSHGQEGVYLLNGSALRVIARTKSSGRGFSAPTLLLDEAQDLPRTALRSLMYTQAAQRGGGQRMFAGTVPEPDAGPEADVWTERRDRGRAGDSNRYAWLEWSEGEEWPDDYERQLAICQNREGWARANPALGVHGVNDDHGIDPETVEGELNGSLGDLGGFARERLSIWPGKRRGGVFTENAWDDLTDPLSKIGRHRVFAIDMPPDRAIVSICVAGPSADDPERMHVELIHRCTVNELIRYLDGDPGAEDALSKRGRLAVHRPRALIIDAASPVRSEIPNLLKLDRIGDNRCKLVITNSVEFSAATGGLIDAVNRKRNLVHIGQGELKTSMLATTVRKVNGLMLVDRDNGADVSPTIGIMLARWGAMITPSKRSAYESDGMMSV